MFTAQHDVAILGAGPAGASAAIRLVEMGFNVAIVERSPFPRAHVGICISDETVALVDCLGVAKEFGGLQSWRRNVTVVKWGGAKPRFVPQRGYHVDRGAFDTLMLDKARLTSVSVYQPAQIRELDRPNGMGWRILLATESGLQLLAARFVIDATGRRSAVPGARVKDGPPLVAIHAQWIPKSESEFDGLIEAGEDAWLWYAQNSRRSAVVSVFCDPRGLRVGRSGDLQLTYKRLLDRFDISTILEAPISAAQACDASSHHAVDPIGHTYIRLGDSCFCVDPMSSQGIHLALQAGLQGAVVVNTILRRPELSGVAQAFFSTRVAAQVSRYSLRTRQEYSRASSTCSSAFWKERSGDAQNELAEDARSPAEPLRALPSGTVAMSPGVTFDVEPVIEGEFIELRRVVRHASLDGSIKYVDGIDVAKLLTVLPETFAYSDLPALWQDHIPPATGRWIAAWLWEKRLLVRFE
ncbi:FAD-dependent monooxygenase [Mesorhizobium sp. M0013]|uniref:flavin-dependent monooxygenase QhpG n=1 Tax=Mesorhizobium sp. M0013 TaxID=2956841 RepID=UPI0033376232